jgi:NitT/TauT family transport system permease protein
MSTQLPNTYSKGEAKRWPIPNHWDVFALLIVVAVLILLGWGAKHMSGQFHINDKIAITLDPWALPGYALRSFLRMIVALFFSLLFTFIFGTWAAKSKAAAKIIIPLIDILQSVPVLGFLSITVVGFIVLFKGSMLGPEAAAIFAIFTAQVWNMTLSLYQSLITVPKSMREAGRMFQLSAWQRFWRIEAPFATPGLIWNMMMSMSGSWVFLTLSEAITVAHKDITLPGIGSYIALAIEKANGPAIGYVIIAMLCVILIYDQILFRPLIAWSEKFKMNTSVGSEEPASWLLNLFQRARAIKRVGSWVHKHLDFFRNGSLFRYRIRHKSRRLNKKNNWLGTTAWYVVIAATVFYTVYILINYIFKSVSLHELWRVIDLGWWTALRVIAVIAISSLIWIPLGVLIGRSHRATQWVQPVAQFLASFPANLLFPIATMWIITYKLNINIWCSPLMILGTQWYILFNVIAGTQALPQNLHDAAGTLRVRGSLWWRRFILPGIFPYYITGVITAAGGAWNLSIVAEALSWGKYHLEAFGLGAYLTQQYTDGNFPQLTLGIAVMSAYVLVINRVLWRPLYQLAEKRFQLH